MEQNDRYLNPETLLNRKEHVFDYSMISSFTGATVMITGAGGTLGTILTTILMARADKLILVGHGENSLFLLKKKFQATGYRAVQKYILADCQNESDMYEIIEEHRPDYVIHCAAHKHVGMLEENVQAAHQNNVLATMRVIKACSAYPKMTAFVLISTDKAVDPISVYGSSKYMAERYVVKCCCDTDTRFVAVRLGNILGSRGSVIGLWEKEINALEPLTITETLASRYFTTPYEAAMSVLTVAQCGINHSVYIARIGAPVYIKDLAQRFWKMFSPETHHIAVNIKGLSTGEKMDETFVAANEKAVETQMENIFRIERTYR